MSFNLLRLLVPPDDPKRVNSWRWFIAIALVVLILDGVFGRGLVLEGAGSYAYASEVAKTDAKLDRMLALSIAQALTNLKTDECRANGNKATIQSTIEGYQLDYKELTGERYPLLTCKELEKA